jgi:hypothetical protein
MNKKNIFGIFVGLFLIISFLGFVQSATTINEGTLGSITPGATRTVEAFGVNKDVTNNHPTLSLMVPVGSSLEWSQFRANAPFGTTIVDTPTGCTTGSDCVDGYYCPSVGGTCASLNALGTCYEENPTSTGYNPQESTEDRWYECGTTGCYTGLCKGSAYACGYYTSLQHNCATGYECNSVGTCVSSGCIEKPCMIDYEWDPVDCRCELVCFIPETKVLMSDGTYKQIIDVEKGEFVQGETQLNEVLGLYIHDYKDKLYSINGGDYFVTPEHPFKTITGWKAINPRRLYEEDENLARLLDPKVLHIGDILITETGTVMVKRIESKDVETEMKVYNLMLDGDHTYYADGYLVHNAKE